MAEYEDGGKFETFFLHLKPYEQAVVQACIEQVLERLGMHICVRRWGKQLGEGLVEFESIQRCEVSLDRSLTMKWVMTEISHAFLFAYSVLSTGRRLSCFIMDMTKGKAPAPSGRRKKSW